jgi:hypothetical protein
VIAVNGSPLWQGRAERSPEEAERVALAYLRYALGGVLGGPTEPPGGSGPQADRNPMPTQDALVEAFEALSREVRGALKRATDFIESGEWKRFL